MKTVLRVLAGAVALVVIAMIGALVALTTIDPNQYRDRLTAEVKDATGREMAIKGNLSVGISLIPTIVAEDVVFANAPWGSRPTMASLKRLESRLQILPLLSGEIRVDRIVLVEPDILLEVAPDGRANWDFGAKSDEPAAIPVVGSFSIDKGKFRYLDQKSNQDLSLALDRVRIDETGADRQLKIEMVGAYNGSPFQIKGVIDPIVRLAADASDFALDLDASAFAANVRIKGAAGKLISGPRLSLDLAVSGKDLNATLLAVKAVMPELDVSAIPPLGGFEISGKATGLATRPSIENLRFAVGTTDALKIEGTGRASGDTYTFDRFAAQIKGSDVGGALTAKTGGKIPDIMADLTAKHFDLADLMAVLPKSDKKPAEPVNGNAAKGAATAKDGRVFPADPLPLDGLKAANAHVTLKAQRLVVEGMAIDGVDTIIVLKDGKLTLDPLAATVADGRLGGRASLDAAGQTPILETNLVVDKMNVGQLLRERGITDQLTGRASAKVNTRGSGASVRAIMASLTGTSEVIVGEGRIKARYVEALAADLMKQLNPLRSEADTKLNCFVSRFDIKQGIATSTGLLFDTERMTVAGGGTVDLRQERLDLTINPEPKDASLVSLAVPLNVTGTFASPSVAPTTGSMVKGVAGLAIMGLTPLGLLAGLAKLGTGDQNPCVAALDQKPAAPGAQQRPGQPAPQQQQPANPVENITKGVQDTFRSILGGGK